MALPCLRASCHTGGVKAPLPPKFPGHGASRFERRGQVLLLYSEGPFNAEHIQTLAPHFVEHGQALAQGGAWATINVVTRSILLTPDAVDMLRRSAEWTRDEYLRVAAGYVVAPEVEGRSIVLPILYECYREVFPVEMFTELDPAMVWAGRLIEASAGRT
jgi:hypothetical protein